ncbi:hypothetical protein B0H14DRAFT_2614858 [Mycena olivaceomarginata]|nr:hypothetical protein B0H14DRAFT_2614858 [Mycena olivaceomarginata]
MLRGSVDELVDESTVRTVTAVEGAGLTTEEKDGVTEDSTFNLAFMTSYTPPSRRSAPSAEAQASDSTPDKEEFETVCKAGSPLPLSLALWEKGIGKGTPSAVVARVSPSSGISAPRKDSFDPAGADAVDFGRLTRIQVAALVLPALSISCGRLAELSVGFLLERGLVLAGAASASAMG